jgi:hypothetical protein
MHHLDTVNVLEMLPVNGIDDPTSTALAKAMIPE